MQAGFAFSKLALRLSSIAELTAQDLDVLADMPTTIRHCSSRETVVGSGERPDCCCLLLQGYLCWKDSERGDGQITSIHVPGDVPDLHTILTGRADSNLSALVPSVVAFVPHAFFRDIAAQSPNMAQALSLLSLADAAVLRNWVVNLGTRDAITRVAHLFCEIITRLQVIGEARDRCFPSPFTQSDLAASCGISAVHANRTIQELRHSGTLQWRSKMITVTDWDALVRIAGFRPDYLQLRRQADLTALSSTPPARRAPVMPSECPASL